MNKKLIVTAMGLVLAGAMGVANADVKLYGQLDLSVNYNNPAPGSYQQVLNQFPPPTTRPDSGDDDLQMSSNNSAIGVKGSEDLGNGLAAFFKVEYQTDVATSSNAGWTGRDQYIGLKMERFGKLTFGAMSTAYKSPGSQIDVAYRTSLQARELGLQSKLHAGKGENGQGRTINTMRYDSPSWAGFSLMGTYNFDQSKEEPDNPGQNDDDTYSIGAQYKGGNFYAAASYIDTNANPDNTGAAQFLAKYTWNALEFHGIYEYDKGLITAARSQGLDNDVFTGGANDDGASMYSVGASYTIGNNIIFADGGSASDSDGSDGIGGTLDDVDDYKSYRVGAIHNMSQRTFVYAGYGKFDPDDDNQQNLSRFSLGVRHAF
jgi:predicted porin